MSKRCCEGSCPPCCEAALVKVEDSTLALVIMILNIIPFTSGIGTMISACVGKEFNCMALVFGILQFLLPLGGWIWSIIWGIMIYQTNKMG